jgi:hypothetical protein
MITIQQDGSGNSVVGTYGPSGGEGLYVDGDLNTIDVMQTGTGHTAAVQAIGDGNTSTITQN